MIIDIDRDEQSLALRDEGHSFVGIAGILGLDSARAANAAFNKPSADKPMLNRRGCEVARWRDSTPYASRLRGRDDLSVEEMDRHFRALKHQRKALFVA